MCIVFFIFGHPKYKLILASNRDESLKRPTQKADFWNIDNNIISAIDLATITNINKLNKDINNEKSTKLKDSSLPSIINDSDKNHLLDEILKDDLSSIHSSSLSESLNKECELLSVNLEKKQKQNSIEDIYKIEDKISGYGTWLGCTRQGLFSTLTNFREDTKSLKPNAISRGYLVRNFLFLKSLYNNNNNIKNSNLMFDREKRKNITSTTTINTNNQKIKTRMHHPRRQAPEKVLKRYEEEDKLYALEDAKMTYESQLDDKNIVNNNRSNMSNNNNNNSNDNNQIDFPYEYMKYVDKNKDKYNGFNLIVGDISLPEPSVWYIGNKDDSSTEKLKKNTIYGMSNGSLNTYWKKVERGKKLFKRAIESHTDLNDLVHKLLTLLSDKKDVPLNKLPKTAFEPKLEKCCAPICIEKERFNGTIFENDYATRTHTILIIDNENKVTMVEQDQYDTITNNFVMKPQCYVSSTIENSSTKNTNPILDEHLTTTIHSSCHSNSNPNIAMSMTMPINIPKNKNKLDHSTYGSSNGSSFHRSFTTSLIPDNNLYYLSPIKNHYGFDNIYSSDNTHNSVPSTPVSLSSIESITGNTLTSLSTSNSSITRSNYLYNNNPSDSSFSTLTSASYYGSINLKNDDNYGDHEKNRNLEGTPYNNNNNNNNNNNKYEKGNANNYLENEIEKFSIESISPIKILEMNDTPKPMKKISSIPPNNMIQTPIVINYFESITSNDYKDKLVEDKPIKSQYVQRNVHDLSKANIHQFKLKI